MTQRHSPIGFCLLFAILAVVSAWAVADDKQAKKKIAATPEQAVEFLVTASKACDLRAALDQMAQPFHDLMMVFILEEEADDALRAALDEKFGKQRREGFRMEVKRDLLRLQKVEILARATQSEAKVKLTVRETVKSFQREGDDIAEMPYLAVKEGKQWKLLRPFTALSFGSAKQDRVAKKGVDGKEIIVFKISFDEELDELGRAFRASLEEREFKGKKLPTVLARLKQEKVLAEKFGEDVKKGKYKTRKEATDAFEKARSQIEEKKP